MKFLSRVSFLTVFMVSFDLLAAGNDFYLASQLLSAAKNGNVALVQNLINSGANVNFVDSTGLSIVCTAVMNNDVRAVQILQQYGADASRCDKEIKKYKNRTSPTADSGVFSGLYSTQKIVLTGAGVAGVVGGLYLLTDIFDSENGNDNGVSGGGHGGGSGGGGGNTGGTLAFTIPYGPAMVNAVAESENYRTNLDFFEGTGSNILALNFDTMNGDPFVQNYLLLMRGYSPLARGYNGQKTLRTNTNDPISKNELANKGLSAEYKVTGGAPVNVALITKNGINASAKTSGQISAGNNSLDDNLLIWAIMNGNNVSDADVSMVSSKYYNNAFDKHGSTGVSLWSSYEDGTLTGYFDLSGNGTAVNNTNATSLDDLYAKIVGGMYSGYADGDFFGFMPNGQMTIFRTGGGKSALSLDIDYKNYSAIQNALLLDDGDYGRRKAGVIANIDVLSKFYASNIETVYDERYKTSEQIKSDFENWIKRDYNVDSMDGENPADIADEVFSFYNNTLNSNLPILIFSTGAADAGVCSDASCSRSPLYATYENAAPLAYSGLNHLFASIVAVSSVSIHDSESSISGYSPSGIILSYWSDDTTTYQSRICGIAGTGKNGVDPWCFAAAGATDKLAVASAAGAFGALQSAFSGITMNNGTGKINNKYLYTLMALTADGPYLAGQYWMNDNAQDKVGLENYLRSMYILPQGYQESSDYLETFKQVFGYGLINLERATEPGKSLYFYDGSKIVSTSGNAYWRSAFSDTDFRLSGAFGARGATISAPFYDVLSSVDGSLSLPRVWNNEFSLGENSKSGLYMGDTLSDLKVRKNAGQKNEIGNFSFSVMLSERAYNDNMAGLDNLNIDYDSEHFSLSADYQHYLTDGESRFTGNINPVLGLMSNAVTIGGKYKIGDFGIGSRAFYGAITDESLLENDPIVSSQFEPGKLGLMMGGQSELSWNKKDFGTTLAFGIVRETDTVLGTYSAGLLDIGGADTQFVDVRMSYNPNDLVRLSLRGTFAYTDTNPNGVFIKGISGLTSNSFSFNADIDNFDLSVALPLAITSGKLHYANAKYDVVENEDGNYDLSISELGIASLNLAPEKREVRFAGSYRHSFGEYTDGALGFIYRINPNNTDEFGDESIFMFKLSHRIGI